MTKHRLFTSTRFDSSRAGGLMNDELLALMENLAVSNEAVSGNIIFFFLFL